MSTDKKIVDWLDYEETIEQKIERLRHNYKIDSDKEGLWLIKELKTCRKELEMYKRTNRELSDTQIDIVEIIERLETDIVDRCGEARKEIIFHEDRKARSNP